MLRKLFYANFFLMLLGMCFWLGAGSAHASTLNETIKLNVDKDFDSSGRAQIQATLVKSTASLYFYVDAAWWDAQTPSTQSDILNNFTVLAKEFDAHIYPTLTSVFGSEWRPGVDNDTRITLLFHPMNSGEGGYFREADEYIKLDVPDSNEREMLYLATDHIGDPRLKVVVAHEFTHLITFNQKNRLQGVIEEPWLNEARADFSSAILGYDDSYPGSNLQRRLEDFLQDPTDSLTEWQGSKYDYASASMFLHYLVDHYSVAVLADSLQSRQVGIASINEALAKEGVKENFSQIFTDWTIALLINDCSVGPKYCYLNQYLKDMRVSPIINFLPISGNSSLSVSEATKNWSPNWQKVIGGSGDLTLNFSSLAGLDFVVPYMTFDAAGKPSIHFLALDKREKGSVVIRGFGSSYLSAVLLPSLQSKTSGFDGAEFTYPYTMTASVSDGQPLQDQALIEQLLAKIASLKQQIAVLLAVKNGGAIPPPAISCGNIKDTLSVGSFHTQEVMCLQQFLSNQPGDIYPEALVTGVFGRLTKAAVIRFQEKYAADILIPAGLSHGTGFAGLFTLQKINQLLVHG